MDGLAISAREFSLRWGVNMEVNYRALIPYCTFGFHRTTSTGQGAKWTKRSARLPSIRS
jgi:hypothetical protein